MARDPVGVLACAGPLPIEVARAARGSGRGVHIVAIDGFAGPEVAEFPNERVSLGQVGRILSSFRRAGVREIVIAGALQRPNLFRLRIDWGFVRNIPTVLALTKGGDDSVLRRVVRFFEGHGLAVVGAGDVAPDLLAPGGALTRRTPDANLAAAIARGQALIAALGPFDIGQAVVVGPAGVVAVEGVRGTDAMLRDLAPGGAGDGRGRDAVLVKLAKPGQETRIDLPTIGPETVRRAAAAGLAGVAVGAGAAIVLERAAVASEADAAGLFVAGIEPAGETAGEAAGEMAEGMVAESVASVAHGVPADSDGAASTASAYAILQVVARRAPTPADRRDIAIGRELVAVLARHGAGSAALISREHVLAVPAGLPLAPYLAGHGRSQSWGRGALRGRLGVLVLGPAAAEAESWEMLDADLFRAAMAAGIAGVVLLATLPEGMARSEIVAWADEAGVFLMHLDVPA